MLSLFWNCHLRSWLYNDNSSVAQQEEMTSALATMRVDYEQIKIKRIEDSSNPLLMKRRKKANNMASENETPAC